MQYEGAVWLVCAEASTSDHLRGYCGQHGIQILFLQKWFLVSLRRAANEELEEVQPAGTQFPPGKEETKANTSEVVDRTTTSPN